MEQNIETTKQWFSLAGGVSQDAARVYPTASVQDRLSPIPFAGGTLSR